jgi:hypothetical protein
MEMILVRGTVEAVAANQMVVVKVFGNGVVVYIGRHALVKGGVEDRRLHQAWVFFGQ